MERNCFGCAFCERIPLSNRYKCKKYAKTLLNFPPEVCNECLNEGKVVEEKPKTEVKPEVKPVVEPVVKEEKKETVTTTTSLYERRRAEIERAIREKRNMK